MSRSSSRNQDSVSIELRAIRQKLLDDSLVFGGGSFRESRIELGLARGRS